MNPQPHVASGNYRFTYGGNTTGNPVIAHNTSTAPT